MFQDKLTREIAAAAAQIKTEPPKNEVNTKSVEGAVVSVMANEELKGNQHKIDANKNGKVDAHDFKLLRGKKGKTVQEGIKGAGVGAALGSVAGGPVGAAIGGALGHVAGEVLSSAKNKTKAMYRIAKGPSMADSKMKREEVEQLDEIGDTKEGRKVISSYVNKALGDKNREKGLRKATSRLYKDNFYGKKANEEVEVNEEDAYSKDRYAVKDGKAKKDNPTHMGSPNYKDQPHHVWATSAEHALKKSMKKEDVEQLDELSKDTLKSYQQKVMNRPSSQNTTKTIAGVARSEAKMKKEEVEQMDEAFPTVADAKKRMAAKESGFEKKKISTGTVYSRKYKAEPEENEEMPKKKAKTMKEMLSIYSTGGAEALVENLMIEEPTNDEYKKEVEVAHAKAEGKIRNDKGIAKAAAQGVKMEEVEIEVYDADEINGVQVDTIDEQQSGYDTLAQRGITAPGAPTRKGSGTGMYLGGNKPRKATIAKATANLKQDIKDTLGKHRKPNLPEEYEEMDEKVMVFHSTSPGSQMKRYQKDSPAPEAQAHRNAAASAARSARSSERKQDFKSGVDVGTKKGGSVSVYKEDYELDERSLTSDEKSDMEKNVKGMKKKLSSFKDRYGDRAKNVMYATAAKIAKEKA